MRRYAITVCRNCGTQYNSTRKICPGYQCGEITPDAVEPNFQRKYRTGPVISDPAAVAEGAGGTNVTPEAAPEVALEIDDDDEE